VSRGSVYDNGQPLAPYLAGLHGCREQRFVALALAVRTAPQGVSTAVTLQVQATPKELQMVFLEPDRSPWRGHAYLGSMLGPDEARRSELRPLFLHLAEHVVRQNLDVYRYLTSADGAA
jgi:hypothetical protein